MEPENSQPFGGGTPEQDPASAQTEVQSQKRFRFFHFLLSLKASLLLFLCLYFFT